MNKKAVLLFFSSIFFSSVYACGTEELLAICAVCFCPFKGKNEKKYHDPIACSLYKCCKGNNFFGVSDDCERGCLWCKQSCISCKDGCMQPRHQASSSIHMETTVHHKNSSHHSQIHTSKRQLRESESDDLKVPMSHCSPVTWQQKVESLLRGYSNDTRGNIVNLCENFLRNLNEVFCYDEVARQASINSLIQSNLAIMAENLDRRKDVLRVVLETVPCKDTNLLLLVYRNSQPCYEKYLSESEDLMYSRPNPLPKAVLKMPCS